MDVVANFFQEASMDAVGKYPDNCDGVDDVGEVAVKPDQVILSAWIQESDTPYVISRSS